MLHEVELRAAELAVQRYGADPARIEALKRSVREARQQGEDMDFFDELRTRNILEPFQVSQLKEGLDQTKVDLTKTNGKQQPAHPSLDLRDLKHLGGFRILRLLGKGGMSAVFLAYDEREKRQVALKVLLSELAQQQPTLDRFYREAKSGTLLNHPNIVRNIDSGQDKATGLHYLVLEYVDGPSALDLLEKSGPLDVGDAVHIILDIARALEHAHSRSTIHRDIKPSNILIDSAGVAKLSDLGLSKRIDEASHLTGHRQGFGTPYYVPYEQALNAKSADFRSDVYALGASFYHLVTGEVPFPGDNHVEIVDKKEKGYFPPARSHREEIPEVVDRILLKMMARDPNHRYQTVSEVIVDLDRTGLAAAVPSFANAEVVESAPRDRRKRIDDTLPDLRVQELLDKKVEGTGEAWFVRFVDEVGNLCHAKLSQNQVAAQLRDGTLNPDAEASRVVQGPFVVLRDLPEFRELVEHVGEKPRRRRQKIAERNNDPEPSRVLWISSLGMAAIVVMLIVIVMLMGWR